MLGSLRELVTRLTRGRLRRTVERALALTPRGFVPHDILRLRRLSAQLKIEWRARDLHPWDRELSADRQAALFREQALVDTDAAIARSFNLLPEVTAIEVRVLEPYAPERVILTGTVGRHDAQASRSLSSPRMRLTMMGVRCRW
jgi:hypothetical protein